MTKKRNRARAAPWALIVGCAGAFLACEQHISAAPKDASRSTEERTFNQIIVTPPKKTVYAQGERGPLLSEIKASIVNVELWYSDNTHARARTFTLTPEAGALSADTGRLDTDEPGEKVFTVSVVEMAEMRRDTFAFLVPVEYDNQPLLSLSIIQLPSNDGADGGAPGYFDFDAPLLGLLDDSVESRAFWADLAVIGHAGAGRTGIPYILPPERYEKTLLLPWTRAAPEPDTPFRAAGFGADAFAFLRVAYKNKNGESAADIADTRALPLRVNNVKFVDTGRAVYDYVPPDGAPLFYGRQGRGAGVTPAGLFDTLWAPEGAAASVVDTRGYAISLDACRLKADGTVFVPVKTPADAVWGNSSRVYGSGVHIVETAAQLAGLNPSETSIYILNNDISLDGLPEWAPLGDLSRPFAGWLYGAGKTIRGLTLPSACDDAPHVGLFGAADRARIENLNIEVANRAPLTPDAAGGCAVGALAGKLTRSAVSYVNVTATAALTLDVSSPYIEAGGLAGGAEDGSILEHCVSDIALILRPASDQAAARAAYAGGLAGRLASGAARDCGARGALALDGLRLDGVDGAIYAGGLAGLAERSEISRCYYAPASREEGIRLDGIRGGTRVSAGGLIGAHDAGTTQAMEEAYVIRQCYAAGVVAPALADGAAALRAGGLAGYARGLVEESYATGAIRASGGATVAAGGLAGYADAAPRAPEAGSYGGIRRCYATGGVLVSGAAVLYGGGLAGVVAGAAAITGSYAAGNVTARGADDASGAIGGIAGMLAGPAPATLDRNAALMGAVCRDAAGITARRVYASAGAGLTEACGNVAAALMTIPAEGSIIEEERDGGDGDGISSALDTEAAYRDGPGNLGWDFNEVWLFDGAAARPAFRWSTGGAAVFARR